MSKELLITLLLMATATKQDCRSVRDRNHRPTTDGLDNDDFRAGPGCWVDGDFNSNFN